MSKAFSFDYLEGDSSACSMLGGDYRSAEHRNSAAENKSALPRDPALAQALEFSNSGLTPCPKRQANIERLVSEGSAAVVTGQQVGLFGGPSFTLYKALSAVAVAERLESESGIPCIPVFWIQNQDHDLLEINRAVVPDAKGRRMLLSVDEPDASENRISLSHRVMNDSIAFVLDSLDQLIGRLPYGQDVLNLLSLHYQPGRTYSSAFTMTLADLTSGTGLLFLDPAAPPLGCLAQPTYRRALEQFEAAAQALQTQGQLLSSSGYHIQVHVRDASPLFFVHPNGSDGPRYRIERDGEAWKTVGGSARFSDSEVAELAASRSQQISPSALLRPLVQDSILPTAAYVAGDAEINYFAQIQPLYDLFEIPKTVVVPRAAVTCVEQKHRRWLDDLGISISQLNTSEAALRSEVLKKRESLPGTNPESLRRSVDSEINNALALLEEAFVNIDRTLLGALDNSRKKIAHQIDSLLTKYEKALSETDQTIEKRIVRLQNSYFPEGIPQERMLSSVYYLARLGPDFIGTVLDAIDPLAGPAAEIDIR